MSNVNGVTGLGPDSLKDRVFVGTVVANDDSTADDGMKRQRIKVTIPSVLDEADGYSIDTLPWCVPHQLVEHGATWGVVDVPSIGSSVYVSFQDGNTGFPFYTGAVIDSDPPAELATHYPHRRGRVLKNGALYWVDEQSGDMKYRLPSGFQITVDASGNVAINVPGNANWTIGGDMNMQVGGSAVIHAGGNATVQANGNAQVKGTAATVEGSGTKMTLAGSNTTVDGNIFAVNTNTVQHGAKNIGASHTHGGVNTGGGHTAQVD